MKAHSHPSASERTRRLAGFVNGAFGRFRGVLPPQRSRRLQSVSELNDRLLADLGLAPLDLIGDSRTLISTHERLQAIRAAEYRHALADTDQPRGPQAMERGDQN
ncbi:hypothetical protein [Jiella marina]|uniref:hypothetical protein n=1 Tax=Jiella sp. LLJ827 TaxID=2917712 RepID=UPI002100CFB4|nr:hypothetical protein [Jiella sp. LLJ827]MCQ0988595.1 hypothetical protein [Jiella sp. LLJ827]